MIQSSSNHPSPDHEVKKQKKERSEIDEGTMDCMKSFNLHRKTLNVETHHCMRTHRTKGSKKALKRKRNDFSFVPGAIDKAKEIFGATKRISLMDI